MKPNLCVSKEEEWLIMALQAMNNAQSCWREDKQRTEKTGRARPVIWSLHPWMDDCTLQYDMFFLLSHEECLGWISQEAAKPPSVTITLKSILVGFLAITEWIKRNQPIRHEEANRKLLWGGWKWKDNFPNLIEHNCKSALEFIVMNIHFCRRGSLFNQTKWPLS